MPFSVTLNARRFNPRPPLLAGESKTSVLRLDSVACFNPRPPLLAGESNAPWVQRQGQPSFNPRPPLLAGESRRTRLRWTMATVSIHARHCWRANRRENSRHWPANEFQSTPAIAGGRIVQALRFKCPTNGFNPRPPLLAGESPVPVGNHAAHHCFNPRPPLLAGESASDGPRPACRSCFNPRPPLLAGESRWDLIAAQARIVSIHARHCWRANR